MRRVVVVVVSAVLLSLLTGACGGGSGGNAASGSNARVALVTDIGGLNDRGFNALANTGLERAEKELGIQGRVFISKSASDYVPNLTIAAREGYDLVIGVGFLMGDTLSTVATQFPDTNFAIVDFPWATLKGAPKNVRGLVFAEQEAGYLVGVAAASVAGDGKVSAFDVENGGVGYGKVSPKAPDRDALIAKLDEVSKQIADGKITVRRR